jgi:hypothetical protein
MGEWKASVTMRIKPTLRVELVEFAAREQRSLGNIGAILLEWGLEQLKLAGSTERLMKSTIRRKPIRTKRTEHF